MLLADLFSFMNHEGLVAGTSLIEVSKGQGRKAWEFCWQDGVNMLSRSPVRHLQTKVRCLQQWQK
ncbi:hypothetical protein ACP70R_025394 [Stipagrostis hirtigluma subsp. patula]